MHSTTTRDAVILDEDLPSEKTLSANKEWMDVTNFLSEAVNDLKIGEMVHGKEFNLYDVMSAIEIMDPKMDIGCGGERVLSVEERLQNGSLKLDLTDIEILQVMDQLLCAEVNYTKLFNIVFLVFMV